MSILFPGCCSYPYVDWILQGTELSYRMWRALLNGWMTLFLLVRFSFCPPNKPFLTVCPNVAKWAFVLWCLSQLFGWVVTPAWAPISMWDYDDEVGAGQHPPAGEDDSPPSYDFSLSSPPQPSQYSKGNFQQTLPWDWDKKMRRFRVKAKLNQFSLNCCDGLILERLSLFALVCPNQTKRSAVRGFCWMFYSSLPIKVFQPRRLRRIPGRAREKGKKS